MSDVTVGFGAKDEGLKAAIGAAQSGAMSLKKAFVGIGSAVAALGSAKMAFDIFKGTADYAGSVADLTAQTGLSAESVMVWGQALKNAGLEAGALQGLMNKLQRAMTGVNEEGEPTNKAFERLGISLSALQDMAPEKQIETVQAAIAGLSDPADRASAAMELFGKSGGKALSLFTDSSALDTARTQLGGLAQVLGVDVSTLDSFSDALGALDIKGMQLAAGFASAFSDSIASATKALNELDLTSLGKGLGEFAKTAQTDLTDMMDEVGLMGPNMRASRKFNESIDKRIAEKKAENDARKKAYVESKFGKWPDRMPLPGDKPYDTSPLGSQIDINTTKATLDKAELDPLAGSSFLADTIEVAKLFPQITDESKKLAGDMQQFSTSIGTGFEAMDLSLTSAQSVEESKKRQLEVEKESLKTQKDIASEQAQAAKDALAAANSQLATIAGAENPSTSRIPNVKSRGVGGMWKKERHGRRALAEEEKAAELEAYGDTKGAKKLRDQASADRKIAFGGEDKIASAKNNLEKLEKTLDALKTSWDALEKKLPTPALTY